ncbi:MAG: hypothetical protein ACOCXP_00340 [Candidatus Dojkabacteria bacterium]
MGVKKATSTVKSNKHTKTENEIDVSRHRYKGRAGRSRRRRGRAKSEANNLLGKTKSSLQDFPKRKFKQRENDYAKVVTETKRPIALIDAEEFYGLTLDMVIYNFGIQHSIQVFSADMLSEFLQKLKEYDFKDLIVLIDPDAPYLKAQEGRNLNKLIDALREKDKRFKLICYTADSELVENGDDRFDIMVLKSARSNQNTLINALSGLLGEEFIMDNTDPEGAYR